MERESFAYFADETETKKMIPSHGFQLNFNSLTDSKASSFSGIQDLNSASSLPWAEDVNFNLLIKTDLLIN